MSVTRKQLVHHIRNAFKIPKSISDDVLTGMINRAIDGEPEPTAPEPVEAAEAPVVLPLVEWWMKTSTEDLAHAARKLKEYGSRDLVMLERVLNEMSGRDNAEPTGELGCWFYIAGKVARATDAIRSGRLPSGDTCADVAIYAMMIRRIRDAGGWR